METTNNTSLTHMKKLAFLTVILAAFLSNTSYAQTTPTVVAGATFTVEATHDGANTLGYRLFIDSAQKAELPVTALASGIIRFVVNGGVAQPGAHTVSVQSYNDYGVAMSEVLAFTVIAPLPSKPTVVRIIVQ